MRTPELLSHLLSPLFLSIVIRPSVEIKNLYTKRSALNPLSPYWAKRRKDKTIYIPTGAEADITTPSGKFTVADFRERKNRQPGATIWLGPEKIKTVTPDQSGEEVTIDRLGILIWTLSQNKTKGISE